MKGTGITAATGKALKASGKTVAVAESCTGGMLGAALTSVPGSSGWFSGGVVAYSNRAKTALLGVPVSVIAREGAVSAEVAGLMARGARRAFGTDLGVGITGIAGPGGGTAQKPVGLVFIAVDSAREKRAAGFLFGGNRKAVRAAACKAALEMLCREASRGRIRPPRRGRGD